MSRREGEDDSDVDEVDGEDDDYAPVSKSKKRRPNDDDEEEEEQEEDDAGGRRRVSQFIDDMADVAADDSEEEDDENEEDRAFIAAGDEDELPSSKSRVPASARNISAPTPSAFRHMNILTDLEGKSEEEIARRYENYHVYDDDGYDGGYPEATQVIDQQARLPTAQDKLWRVRVKRGFERQIVLKLLQKSINLLGTPQALQIGSAVACDHLVGCIYVEGKDVNLVRNAVNGLDGVYRSVDLVRVEDMPTVLKTVSKALSVNPGDWVRMKRGTYAGDLCQVESYDEQTQEVVVKLIPRIDWKKYRTGAPPDQRGFQRGKKVMAPPQKFFGLADLEGIEDSSHREVEIGGREFIEWNNMKFRKGHLYKTCPIKSLQLTNIDPSIAETQKFLSAGKDAEAPFNAEKFLSVSCGIDAAGTSQIIRMFNQHNITEENLIELTNPERVKEIGVFARYVDKIVSGAKAKQRKAEDDTIDFPEFNKEAKHKVQYFQDDCVVVTEGGLKHVIGRVTKVDGDNLEIKANDESLGTLMLSAHEVQKHFKVGDHVKALGGRHQGQTGTIVKKEGRNALIMLDIQWKEIQVQMDLLQVTSETSAGYANMGPFQLHDLVQLPSSGLFGCIVNIDRDSFRILDTNGVIHTYSLQALGGHKRGSPHAIGVDHDNVSIQRGDLVEVLDGPYKGRQGRIEHISRIHVFIHSRQVMENSGIYVVRTRACRALGGKATQWTDATLGPGGVPRSPGAVMASPRSGESRGEWSGGGGGRGKRAREDDLKGKTVIITKGPYKGFGGIVKSSTETNARVELHSNYKEISVERSMLQRKDSSGVALPRPGYDGMRSEGNRTPAWGEVGRTPQWSAGASTPMWAPGGSTPMWDGARSSRDPGTPSRDGSRTPMSYNEGSHTPLPDAWNPSASTPRRSWDGGNFDDYNLQTGAVPTPGAGFSPLGPDADHYGPSTPSMSAPYSPYTPSANTPYQPATPAVSLGTDAAEDTPANSDGPWLLQDIAVKINSQSFGGGGYHGLEGTVREVLDGGLAGQVFLWDRDETLRVPASQLAPLPLKKGDRVVVCCLHPEHGRGVQGLLANIDGLDGVVKQSSDIKVSKLACLARLNS